MLAGKSKSLVNATYVLWKCVLMAFRIGRLNKVQRHEKKVIKATNIFIGYENVIIMFIVTSTIMTHHLQS